MTYQIDLQPVAEIEFWDAVDWFDEQKDGLGKLFARAFEKVVQLIAEHPTMFPVEFETNARL